VSFVVLITGFLLGFVGSMPVSGPISVLVLTLGMRTEFRRAIGVAAGGATAEAVYAFLAFWGFSRYLARYPVLTDAAKATAALILVAIGWSLVRWRSARLQAPAPSRARAAHSGFLVGFSISILNPTLILTWTAVTSIVLLGDFVPAAPPEALPFCVGTAAGIVAWFLLMLAILRRYQARLHPEALRRALRGIGWLVMAGGAVLLALAVRDMLRLLA